MTHRFAIALCLTLLLCPGAGYGQTWNLLDDFSATDKECEDHDEEVL